LCSVVSLSTIVRIQNVKTICRSSTISEAYFYDIELVTTTLLGYNKKAKLKDSIPILYKEPTLAPILALLYTIYFAKTQGKRL
jgi:hypothetical protein